MAGGRRWLENTELLLYLRCPSYSPRFTQSTTTSVPLVLGNRSTRPPSRGWIGSWGVIRSPMVGLQDIVSDGPTHRLPMENRPCKHGSLTTTIPPVSDGVHAIMRPTSGLLVLALASRAGLSSQVLGTLSGWPPCLLCLPMRACAQPGLAVRAVSAIGAHLELAGRLGMVGLGILRSPAAVHALGDRAEGNFPAVHAHRSKNGGAAWFGSPPSRHPRSTVPPCHS